ncbi:MAG: hypothetical protein Q8P92_03095 [Candidatus Daviesbacteria bacterium]|nr:hypothetical protein [Candidatus Daviesbacteria bacterium]
MSNKVKYWFTIIGCSILGSILLAFIAPFGIMAVLIGGFSALMGGGISGPIIGIFLVVGLVLIFLLSLIPPKVAEKLTYSMTKNEVEGINAYRITVLLQLVGAFIVGYFLVKLMFPTSSL